MYNMKLALVFLIAICTIGAQGSANLELTLNFNGTSGLLDEFVNNISKSLQRSVDDILKGAQAIVDTMLGKLDVKKAQETVVKQVKEISDKLVEIAEANRKCVENQLPQIELLDQETQAQFKTCNNNAIEESKNILNHIQLELNAVRDNINALRDVVNNCSKSSNILEVPACVYKKSSEIRKNAIAAIDNARKILVCESAKVTETVSDG